MRKNVQKKEIASNSQFILSLNLSVPVWSLATQV